jgi:hypothetical protein
MPKNNTLKQGYFPLAGKKYFQRIIKNRSQFGHKEMEISAGLFLDKPIHDCPLFSNIIYIESRKSSEPEGSEKGFRSFPGELLGLN